MIKKTSKNGNHNDTDTYLNKSSCDDMSQQKSKRVKTSKRVKKKNNQSFKFKCKICKFYTNNRKDYKRHMDTKKHMKMEKMTPNHYECICGNTYKHQSGLSRHKKKCIIFYNTQITDIDNNYHCYPEIQKKAPKKRHQKKGTTLFSGDPEIENRENQKLDQPNKKLEKEGDKEDDISLKDILLMQLKQQNDTIELLKQSIDTNKQMMPKIGNNNNNTISINVFLNEQCKNAMNLTDFINKMNVSIEDLEYSRDNGFVEGVTNIFAKQLHDLKPTERPFHCTDKKRLQFYVKDDDKWEKDNNGEKIDKTIYNIKMKQAKKLSEWEKLHPNYTSDPKLLDEWQSMLNSMTEDTSNDSSTKIKMALKRNMAEKINFKEATLIKIKD